MDPQVLVAGLIRGVGLLGLAVATGGLALDWLVLPAGFAASRARLRRVVSGALAVLLLMTAVDLIARTQAMSRAPLGAAIAVVPDVVAHTHVGLVLGARAAGLILALLLSLARAPAVRALCTLLVLAVALSTGLIGHAADWGDLTTAVFVDWMHAVTASAWTGGLIALAFVVLHPEPGGPPASPGALGWRFSRLAGVCLLGATATGAYNAWAQLGALTRLWSTAYGQVLIAKLLLVAALAWMGAINRYVNLPRLEGPRAARGLGARLFRRARLVVLGPRRAISASAASARLGNYLTGEAIVALAVLACTAALGQITPGRHVSFDRKPTSHVTLVQPRTGGGGSRLGTVTPPPGDAAHGRAVFVRLRCFACHAVREGGFPDPSQPGPELGGVGSRHPGYLVESIMNPNALIVDGPGYTDDRGLSTMPDYRDRLNVGELIDLVAYLKTLGAPVDLGGRPR